MESSLNFPTFRTTPKQRNGRSGMEVLPVVCGNNNRDKLLDQNRFS